MASGSVGWPFFSCCLPSGAVMFYSTSHIQSGYASMILLSTLTMWVLDSFGLYVQYI